MSSHTPSRRPRPASSTRPCATASSRRASRSTPPRSSRSPTSSRGSASTSSRPASRSPRPATSRPSQAIAREVEGPVIGGLARANAADIEPLLRARSRTPSARASTRSSRRRTSTSSTSCSSTREDVKGQARAAVAHAKAFCDDVEFSPMDATRADVEFTAEVLQIALDEGATTINIPDTVGYAMPDEYAAFLEAPLRARARSCATSSLSMHCHDDLGLAVANSFAGVLAGARQVECAINGIGERAGNASLEEIVMLLHTRGDVVGLHTGVVTTEIARTSRGWSRRLTGYVVQPNKAIVGRNAFAHESGIHQDGVLKERTTYEIMDATHRRPRRQLARARQALGPPRAEAGARGPGLRGRRRRRSTRLQALQGDRGQEEAGHRDGPRGAGHRRAARRARRLHARVVRRRGLARRPPHATVAVAHARRRRSSRASSPATARSTRSSARSTPRPGSTRGCASSASTRSPAARTRSARLASCSSSSGRGRRPGRRDRHHRGGRARLRARALQRRAQGAGGVGDHRRRRGLQPVATP